MEIQETIIVFILGLIAGVIISKHIGNWAINRLTETLKDKINEVVKAKEVENE